MPWPLPHLLHEAENQCSVGGIATLFDVAAAPIPEMLGCAGLDRLIGPALSSSGVAQKHITRRPKSWAFLSLDRTLAREYDPSFIF
jgi:hypothetical protein